MLGAAYCIMLNFLKLLSPPNACAKDLEAVIHLAFMPCETHAPYAVVNISDKIASRRRRVEEQRKGKTQRKS